MAPLVVAGGGGGGGCSTCWEEPGRAGCQHPAQRIQHCWAVYPGSSTSAAGRRPPAAGNRPLDTSRQRAADRGPGRGRRWCGGGCCPSTPRRCCAAWSWWWAPPPASVGPPSPAGRPAGFHSRARRSCFITPAGGGRCVVLPGPVGPGGPSWTESSPVPVRPGPDRGRRPGLGCVARGRAVAPGPAGLGSGRRRAGVKVVDALSTGPARQVAWASARRLGFQSPVTSRSLHFRRSSGRKVGTPEEDCDHSRRNHKNDLNTLAGCHGPGPVCRGRPTSS
jgi:hypothetical protein